MSDDKPINPDVDLDLSSKKKKKKKTVTIEEADGVATPVVEQAPEKTPEPAAVDAAELDLSKKKKKKKKTDEDAPVEETPAPAAAAAAPAPAAAAETASTPAQADDDAGDNLDLKKKKKKKKTVDESQPAVVDDAVDAGSDDLALEKKKKKKSSKSEKAAAEADAVSKPEVSADSLVSPWAGSDRDYTYEELLKRVTDILREKNPELGGEKKRFAMKPPDVVREGTKKTVFLNFADICKTMHRNIDHVYQFMMAELGTSGSIDGSLRMVIKGRFQQRAIESILRRYVLEYVTCASCKSPDTNLTKDNRLFFVDCNQCGAQRSVAAIKQGYVAQVGKRKKV